MGGDAYPIAEECRDYGIRWREEFIRESVSSRNGFEFLGSPEVNFGLSLNGVDQYGEVIIRRGVVDQPRLLICSEFIPDFGIPPASSKILFDTKSGSRFLVYVGSNGILYVDAGGTSIIRISQANYETAWRIGGRNAICISAVSGNNLICLNGSKLTNSAGDSVAWSPSELHQRLIVGSNWTHSLFFSGVMKSVLAGAATVEQVDAERLSLIDGPVTVLSDLDPVNSLASLPLQRQFPDLGGKTVTPSLGALADDIQQPMLGRNGTDTAYFPAKLSDIGYRLAANDTITLPATRSLQFADVAGDLPFSFCLLIKKSSYVNDLALIQRVASPGVDGFRIGVNSSTGVGSFELFDGSSNKIGRTGLLNNVHIGSRITALVFTYDGSKTSAGVRFYSDATRRDSSDSESGSYAGIGTTLRETWIGSDHVNDYLVGDLYKLDVYRGALTPLQAALWCHRARRLVR